VLPIPADAFPACNMLAKLVGWFDSQRSSRRCDKELARVLFRVILGRLSLRYSKTFKLPGCILDLSKSKKEIDMPTETIVVAGFVAAVITIFSLTIAYGQRQTTAYRREHPQN
jgi:hypothetical protein